MAGDASEPRPAPPRYRPGHLHPQSRLGWLADNYDPEPQAGQLHSSVIWKIERPAGGARLDCLVHVPAACWAGCSTASQPNYRD